MIEKFVAITVPNFITFLLIQVFLEKLQVTDQFFYLAGYAIFATLWTAYLMRKED